MTSSVLLEWFIAAIYLEGKDFTIRYMTAYNSVWFARHKEKD